MVCEDKKKALVWQNKLKHYNEAITMMIDVLVKRRRSAWSKEELETLRIEIGKTLNELEKKSGFKLGEIFKK